MGLRDKLAELLSYFKVPRTLICRIGALLIIYVVGLVLRLQPILMYGANHRAYDPFIQYRATQILIEEGLLGMLSYYDFKYWYPFGSSTSKLYIIVPLVGYIIYVILNALGFHVDLLMAITIAPAILGSFCIIAVYFIGREIKNDNVGLIAALVTAVAPGFLQRSIAGFYDNEMSILFILLLLLFYIKAIKTGSIAYSIISGFFGGIVCWSWGIWRYILAILAIYTFLRMIGGKIDSNDSIAYGVTITLSVAMGIMIPRNYGIITSTIVAVSIAVLLLVFLNYLALLFSRIFGKTRIQMFKIFLGIGLVCVSIGLPALFMLGYLKTITGKFASILNPFLREKVVTYTSVAENQPGVWTNFYMGAGLGVLFVPIAIYAMIERRHKVDLLLFLLVVTSFYFAASITRYIVLGSPLISLAVGLGVDYLIEPYARFLTKRYILHKSRVVRIFLGERRPPRNEAFAVYAIIFLVFLLSVNQCISMAKYYSGYDYTTAEREIFYYLNTHANPNDVVLSWWDYGYRCTVIANISTLADNGTRNSTQMGVVGSMLMLPPPRAIWLMRKYNVKWVLVYSVDLAKAIWMIKIASKHAPMYGVHEKDYLNKEEMRYREPFFHSVLWHLLAYKEDTRVPTWVERYGESKLKDKGTEFKVSDLVYFELVMKKTYGNEFVKLYRVVWPINLNEQPSYVPGMNVTRIISGGE